MIQAIALAGMIVNGVMVQEVEPPQKPDPNVYDMIEEVTGADLPEMLYVKGDNVTVEEKNGIIYLESKEPKVIVKERVKEVIKYVEKPDEPAGDPAAISSSEEQAQKEKPAVVSKQAVTPKQEAAPEQQGTGDWQPFTFTYYTAACEGCSGVTSTGVDVRSTSTYQGMRVLAVNPAVIPYWSIVEVQLDNGTSFRGIALDTGGKMRQQPNVIDVLTGSDNEAFANGVDSGKLRFIRKGKG